MDKNKSIGKFVRTHKKQITVSAISTAIIGGVIFAVTKNKNAVQAMKIGKEHCWVGFMEDINNYPSKGDDYVSFMKFVTNTKTCTDFVSGFGGLSAKAGELGNLGKCLMEGDDEITEDTLMYIIYKGVYKR